MANKQERHPRNPGRALRAWSEFSGLCRRIENVAGVPFRVLDAQGNPVFQSQKPFDGSADTTLTLSCRHKKKTYFQIACSANEAHPEKVLDLMFVLKDIGLHYQLAEQNREMLFEEIIRTYRHLHFFYTLPSLLSQNVSRNRLCQITLERICRILNVERGSLFLYNAYTRSLQLAAFWANGIDRPAHAAMNTRILSWITQRGRSLLIEEIKQFPEFKGKGQYRTGSFITAPFYYHPSVRQKRIAGVINLADPVGRPHFTSHDLKFVSSAIGFAVFLAMTKPE